MARLTKDDFRTSADRGLETIERRFEVISPVFGGGVRIDPDKPHDKPIDEVTPVRGAAVRGQLRFWWRATHGCRADSIAEMKQREDALWGSAQRHGAVTLEIVAPSDGSKPEKIEVFEGSRPRRGMEALAYGAFPLQPAKQAAAGVLHRLKGEWKILLTCPLENVPEVKDAVDAWLAFGGIGGRTRRGFGACACALGSTTASTSPRDFLGRMASWTGPRRAGFPSLRQPEQLVVTRHTFRTCDEALGYTLDRLRRFRQGQGMGRNEGREHNRPGRSRWPEADAIRRLTGKPSPAHAEALDGIDAFPRAAFGLPILFHFKDGGDPADTTLHPRGKERHASQLILRPFRDGRDFRAMALVLGGERAEDGPLVLEETGGPHEVTGRLDEKQAAQLRVQPVKGGVDVLDAFLDFFRASTRD